MHFLKNKKLRILGLLFIITGIAIRFKYFESDYSPYVLGGLIGGGMVLLFDIGGKGKIP